MAQQFCVIVKRWTLPFFSEQYVRAQGGLHSAIKPSREENLFAPLASHLFFQFIIIFLQLKKTEIKCLGNGGRTKFVFGKKHLYHKRQLFAKFYACWNFILFFNHLNYGNFFASACYFLSIWSEIKINGHHNAETRFAFTNKVQYFRATLKIKSVETLCKLGFRSCWQSKHRFLK